MDIREYLQTKERGFYKILCKNLTVERRKQFYDAINSWHESELKLLNTYNVSGSSLLNQCLSEQEEIISSPIRFNGVHINKLKQVFLKNGIEADELKF